MGANGGLTPQAHAANRDGLPSEATAPVLFKKSILAMLSLVQYLPGSKHLREVVECLHQV